MHGGGGCDSSGEFLKTPRLLKQTRFLMRTHLSHLLKRSAKQFYRFIGNHWAPPGSRCCWTLGNTTHCFKKQREMSSRRAGQDVQKTCIEVSMRFVFTHPPEHPLTIFSELWAHTSKQLVLTVVGTPPSQWVTQ